MRKKRSLYSFVAALLLSLISSLIASAQINFDVVAEWEHLPNPNKILYEQLLDAADVHRMSRDSAIKACQTKSQWEARQKWVQEKLHSLVGAFPKKTPLYPKVTGTIDHQKYTIEKLHFQSRPEFYVTAALFIPKQIRTPAPAILFCSGHTSEGFRSDTYQHMILNYVQKGFIVLAFDPVGQGERSQYLDNGGRAFMKPTHDHSYVGNQVFLNGISPANYFIWDGIRAIDYLVSRPEVDSSRIGVTGRSGGGTQTAYLMAFDRRVRAAAPECYLTTFDKLLKSRGPQDAEQNIYHFLDGLDLADLVEVRAPKPTLMVTTTRDIFSIAGAREIFAEARKCYGSFSAEDYLQMVEDDAPHASTRKNREATYAFFQKYLENPGLSRDEEVDTLSEEDLWVTSSGQVNTDLSSTTIFTINGAIAKKLQEHRSDLALLPNFFTDLPDKIKNLIGYEGINKLAEVIYSGRENFDNYSIEKYLIAVSSRHYIPVVWLQPTDLTGRTILLLDDQGKANQADTSSLAVSLGNAGHQVFMTDLSGVGELGGGFLGGDANLEGVPINEWYAGVLTHKSPVAVRVAEMGLVVELISNLCGSQSIDLITKGTLGADALHAASQGISFSSMVLINNLISYNSILQTKKYYPKFMSSAVAGSNKLYDLEHLAHFAPDNLYMIDPVNALSAPADAHSIDAYNAFRQQALQIFKTNADHEVAERVMMLLK